MWVKIWIVGTKLEVLVNRGSVRVIIREGKGPATVVECPVEEIQIEETLKELDGDPGVPGLTA